ncbi:MAG: LysR family transcriptional regulator [Pseudomonadota bacterium]
MEKTDYLDLNAKQLRLFLAVLELESVSKAADELDLNQSTVSYSLEKLRTVFGDPLFVKQGRGILPTDTAQEIAPQIREILLELEVLATAREYDPLQDKSEISIATNVMELMPYCNAIKIALNKEAPNTSVRFLELGSRANIRHMLETQEVNFVISVRPAKLPTALLSTPLLTFEQVCFYDGSRRGPVNTVEDYCEAPHATLDFGGSAKSTIDSTLDALSMSRKVALKAPNCAALANLMKGTDCISTMQVDLRRYAMSGFDYCEPPIIVPSVNFDLIWHRRSRFSEKISWLRELIKTAVRREVDGLPVATPELEAQSE